MQVYHYDPVYMFDIIFLFPPSELGKINNIGNIACYDLRLKSILDVMCILYTHVCWIIMNTNTYKLQITC